MRISTKGRYALRLMLDLAVNDDGRYIKVKEIAARQGISDKYLEQIVAILNKTDILQTNRGFQGGYKLAKPPAHYTVGSILRLTEGSLSPVACLDHDPASCPRHSACATLPVWQGLEKVINEYLDAITLQDILDEQRQAQNKNDYVI